MNLQNLLEPRHYHWSSEDFYKLCHTVRLIIVISLLLCPIRERIQIIKGLPTTDLESGVEAKQELQHNFS